MDEINLDTTGNKPYIRTKELIIRYSEEGVPTIYYLQAWAIIDGNGKVHQLNRPEMLTSMDWDALPDVMPHVHPATRAPLGSSVTKGMLMLDMLAAVHQDQTLKIAQAAAAQAAAEAAQAAAQAEAAQAAAQAAQDAQP